MTRQPKTTVLQKQRWLLSCRGEWSCFDGLTAEQQTVVLTALFTKMKQQGFYSLGATLIDGRVGLRKIIRHLTGLGLGKSEVNQG